MHPGIVIAIFLASTLIGYKLIKNVPSLLHTPLMSGMNALSGVTVLGALAATITAIRTENVILAGLAIIFAIINVVGGFFVTGRMLKMFNRKTSGQPADDTGEAGQ
ncbi:MAG: NAD(P) transhydrogenase subunit alpha [Treponema sp.]|jgi:NAD(P) transhydrogenase subunit alpha|nr:NAD(P) transhydrogenase subunit alpha [Treponema sp.]